MYQTERTGPLAVSYTHLDVYKRQVLFLQTNYGPQRLTVEQSEQLHTELRCV